jgi:phosphate-selective porin
MTLNFRSYLSTLFASALLLGASSAAWCADAVAAPATANAIITVKPARSAAEATTLGSNEVIAYTGKNRAQVTSVERLQGDQAAMQLFIFLDDST